MLDKRQLSGGRLVYDTGVTELKVAFPVIFSNNNRLISQQQFEDLFDKFVEELNLKGYNIPCAEIHDVTNTTVFE